MKKEELAEIRIGTFLYYEKIDSVIQIESVPSWTGSSTVYHCIPGKTNLTQITVQEIEDNCYFVKTTSSRKIKQLYAIAQQRSALWNMELALCNENIRIYHVNGEVVEVIGSKEVQELVA